MHLVYKSLYLVKSMLLDIDFILHTVRDFLSVKRDELSDLSVLHIDLALFFNQLLLHSLDGFV